MKFALFMKVMITVIKESFKNIHKTTRIIVKSDGSISTEVIDETN